MQSACLHGIEANFISHRHHELVIYIEDGSGRFLSYQVLEYVHNRVYTLLLRDSIPQENLRIEDDYLIVSSGHLDSIYTWSEKKGFLCIDCVRTLVPEIDACTILLQYIITDDEKVRFYMNGERYPSMTPIELQVGQKLQLQRICRSPYERILGDGNCLQLISRHEHLAQVVGVASIQIIPQAYDWKYAMKIHVKVLPQNPIKESFFGNKQKALLVRKKKSIKEQIKKFLKNHSII